MKKLILCVAVLGLTGCAAIDTITGNNVSPTTVYVAANSFDALEGTAANYLKLPICGSLPCRTQALSQKLVTDMRAGRLIRNQLEALINAGNGNAIVPTSIYNSLVAVVTAINSDIGA